MIKTYKFRIYPSKKQETLLNKTLQICQQLYNHQLEYERYIFAKNRRFVERFELNDLLPDLKIINPYFKLVHSQVLQDVNYRVTKAFKSFFGRIKKGGKAGYPRFKTSYNSFAFPQSGFNLNKKLKLSKIGEIPIKLHRKINGDIKNLIIIKTVTNKWFACFNIEQKINPIKRGEKSIGIDLGLDKFATLSNGKVIENPKYMKKSLKLLKKKSKQFSKKNKNSRNRKKARLELTKLYEKIHSQRIDFLHKTTKMLIRDYDCIALEDLKPSRMKNKYLQFSINDVSWDKFAKLISYKAIEAGVGLDFVNPKNTSQNCSGCKKKVRKKLSTRIHKCPYCRLVLDRDLNAALNILQKSCFSNKIPLGQRESTPEKLFH